MSDYTGDPAVEAAREAQRAGQRTASSDGGQGQAHGANRKPPLTKNRSVEGYEPNVNYGATSSMTAQVIDILEQSRKTFCVRNDMYGDNWQKVGEIMAILFPDGVELNTADDHNWYHLFSLQIVKLTRYAVDPKDGNSDSLTDQINYIAMLQALDERRNG